MSFSVATPEFFQPASSGRFLPSDLAEVFCWLRSDTPDKITEDVGVDSWQSEVGSFDFVQATSTQQPLFVAAGGPNGVPRIEFDGVDDRLVYSGSFQAATVGETFIVANRKDPTNDNGTFFGLGLVGAATPWLVHSSRADSAGGAIRHDSDSVAAISSANGWQLAGFASLMNWRSDDTNISMFQNRISVNTPAAQLWYGDITGHDRATIGGLTRTTFTLPFEGWIYELIFCSAVLSEENRAKILHYLRRKYHPLMTFAALGDSLTAAGGTSSWLDAYRTSALTSFLNYQGLRIHNHAVADEDSGQTLTRWTNEVKGKGYDGIILLSSVNDVADEPGLTAAQSIANLKQMVDEALAEQMHVVISTIWPFGDATAWSADDQVKLDEVNGWIRGYVAENRHRKIQLIDGYRAFGSGNDPAKGARDLMAADGLHASASGDALFVELVRDAVERLTGF